MIHRHIIYTKFSPWRFTVSKAEGSYFYDEQGKQYIDFTSGWNVINLGWNRPEIKEAVKKQLDKNAHANMWFADEIQEKYASKLCHYLPKELDAISRVNGGAEANEHAINLVRSYTRRKKILGFKASYHGNSVMELALGSNHENLQPILPADPSIIQMDFPDTYRTEKNETEILHEFRKQLEMILKNEDMAAVVCETGVISGWGSVAMAPLGFLTTIRELSKKYGTLLILDEVGTGFSRTGKLFALEHENIVPDILTLAKGISNGVCPIGAMVTRSDIVQKGLEVKFELLQSTFGWAPVSCAAALKTLEIHTHERIWEKAEESGRYLIQQLKEKLADHPNVGDIRGMGMLVGIDLVADKKSKTPNDELGSLVVKKAFTKGLHVVGGDVIQLMPPLTIEKEILDEGIKILVEVIKECK